MSKSANRDFRESTKEVHAMKSGWHYNERNFRWERWELGRVVQWITEDAASLYVKVTRPKK